MATHRIGKIKFNLSKRGFAYRIGAGEIHRIPFGKSESREYEEDYSQRDDVPEDRYDNNTYPDDGYGPDSGYEEDYAPEEYESQEDEDE